MSKKSAIHEWLQSPENQQGLEEERLITEISENIWALLNEKGVLSAQLAEKLGKSRPFVSQLLDGSRNMTLRTLADIAYALDTRVRVEFCDL